MAMSRGKKTFAKNSKIFYPGKFKSQEDWDLYIKWERVVLNSLLIFNDDIKNYYIEAQNTEKTDYNGTCRSAMKTSTWATLNIVRVLNVPWWNVCHSTLYFDDASGLVEVYTEALNRMNRTIYKGDEPWLLDNELDFILTNSLYQTGKFTFEGRNIHFPALTSPSKRRYAGTNDRNFTPRFCLFLIDEILEQSDEGSNGRLTFEQQENYIKQIEKNLNRGVKAPFGISWKKVYCFNSWDIEHPVCAKLADKQGLDYRNQGKNYLKLYEETCETLTEGCGYIINEDDDSRYFTMSYLSIPDEIRQTLMPMINKERVSDDYTFKVAWCGIPGVIFNDKLQCYWALPKNKLATIKTIKNEKSFNISYSIGIDVGTRDETVAVLCRFFYLDDKYIMEIVDIYKTSNKSHSTIVEDLKKFFKENKVDLDTTILVDPRGGGSNLIMEINNRTDYRAQPATSKSEWKDINVRVAKINQLLMNKQLVINEKKETLNKMIYNSIRQIEVYNQEHLHAGERNERNKPLDIINAIEYAMKFEYMEF